MPDDVPVLDNMHELRVHGAADTESMTDSQQLGHTIGHSCGVSGMSTMTGLTLSIDFKLLTLSLQATVALECAPAANVKPEKYRMICRVPLLAVDTDARLLLLIFVT